MEVRAQFPDEQSAAGEFMRQPDAFRKWVTADGSSAYPSAPGRYHLYVSWACPWAHRTIIVRKLKQLDLARRIDDLCAPPANRLEQLKGDRAGQWSIRVNDQFRICFRWTGADAEDVEIVDYH